MNLSKAYQKSTSFDCLPQHKIFEREIISLRQILGKAKIDVLWIDETKLDFSFPDHQFKIEGYQFPPLRRD